jgi:hypothetical protein
MYGDRGVLSNQCRESAPNVTYVTPATCSVLQHDPCISQLQTASLDIARRAVIFAGARSAEKSGRARSIATRSARSRAQRMHCGAAPRDMPMKNPGITARSIDSQLALFGNARIEASRTTFNSRKLAHFPAPLLVRAGSLTLALCSRSARFVCVPPAALLCALAERVRARRDARRRAAKRSPLLAKDTTRATAQRVR